MSRILIVEDNESLSSQIAKMLARYDYDIYEVKDFKNVVEKILNDNANLVLLDINLPYYDGFHILKEIRKSSKIPVIIISARNSDAEQIMGLEFGADDYVVKPFSLEILHAKIRSSLRRSNNKSYQEFIVGNTKLNINNFLLHVGNKKIELTKNECKLLVILIDNLHSYVSRELLLSEIWDEEAFVEENTLNVYISRLKSKLASYGSNVEIVTKRGYGYMLSVEKE